MSKKNSGKTAVKRDFKGRFAKGIKKIGGNKKGSRHLSVITRETLEEAIRKSDKTHNTTLLTHFIETAREDSHVLIALMKKILADKKEVDAHIEGGLEVLLRKIEDGSDRGLPKAGETPE